MWFVDQAQITIKAGDGGRGCSAFAQPPYTRYPSADGGDGGNGGDVMVRTDPNAATLLDFHFRRMFHAGRGGHGGGNKKTGRRGEDVVIRVPVGTVIHDEDTGTVLRDLTEADEQVAVARGGRGGLGNATADEAAPGMPGEVRRIRLELKLIADVGIMGFPNAGKSSLLSKLSSARPKIGPYPFTTRYPVLGVVKVGDWGSFVACDIPGLIEGAHEGRGLGIQFLRHIERTRILVHVIDMAAVDGRDPVAAYHQLNEELNAYSPALATKPQLIVANKMDVTEAAEQLNAFRAAVSAASGRMWSISCATGAGIPELIQGIWQALRPAE